MRHFPVYEVAPAFQYGMQTEENFRHRRRPRRGQCRAGHGGNGAQARSRGRACFHPAESAHACRRARGRRSCSARTRGFPVTCSRTRSSPESLRSASTCSSSGRCPTPGVAYITRSLRADAGIVLSASHNPYEDNGIKFFRHDGYKLDDQIEAQIEHLVFTGEIDSIRPTAGKIGRATRIDDALGRYVEFAKASFPRRMSLEEMRIAVDVANGAAYKSTPCILRELGADVIVAHNEPNGTNINDDCGSTHPEEIQRIVKETGADVGITHDGDADRVLLCDENGEIVDGDEILAIAALDLLQSRAACARTRSSRRS